MGAGDRYSYRVERLPRGWRTQREAISFCLTFGSAILTGALVDVARIAGWIDRGIALWLLGLPVTLLLIALIAFRPRRRFTAQ